MMTRPCGNTRVLFCERNMKKEYKITHLTSEFYKKYEDNKYNEIEKKLIRPYLVLLIKIESNTFAIPFRTNVNHKYCYHFKKSGRKTDKTPGLDFTKAVIVNDKKYIGNSAFIDNQEYVELNRKYYYIVLKFRKYVADYYRYINGELNEYEAKAYEYSTLQYFHKELHITTINNIV